jgi:prepilin-type N-terminal cleavage/methylation domain-containing protein/prepilin-type processing-associated H-X9-DG protein
MNRNRPTYPTLGFTLLELLCVIAVIAILAAMLLPALSQGGAHARRVACVNYLREIGIAFHSFAHDHNSQFPMNVPMDEGGSKEFVQAGYQANGLFYFAFRHFQTLSNGLGTPKPLICPSDTRLAATSFGSLSNDNVSYFAGLKADYNQPNSILAGDRNITNDWAPPTSILRLDSQQPFRWTGEMHRFKGNLLFADGRVEEWGSTELATIARAGQPPSDVALPSVVPTGPGSGGPNSTTMSDSGGGSGGSPDNTFMPMSGGGGNTGAGSPNQPPATNQPKNLVQSPYMPYRSGGPSMDARGAPMPVSAPPDAPQTVATKPPVKAEVPASGTNAVDPGSVAMMPQATPPAAPRLFSPQIAQVGVEEPEKRSNWLLYLLLILMGLSAMALGAAAWGKRTQERT